MRSAQKVRWFHIVSQDYSCSIGDQLEVSCCGSFWSLNLFQEEALFFKTTPASSLFWLPKSLCCHLKKRYHSPLKYTFLQKVIKAMRKGSHCGLKYLFFTTNLAGKYLNVLLEISNGFTLLKAVLNSGLSLGSHPANTWLTYRVFATNNAGNVFLKNLQWFHACKS